MKVRAIELGFYNNRRRPPGEVFVLKPYKKVVEKVDPETKVRTKEIVVVTADDQFSDRWMQKVNSSVDVKVVQSKRQFGKHQPHGVVDSVGAAKATHEPLSDDDALAVDDGLEELEADEESQSDQSVL